MEHVDRRSPFFGPRMCVLLAGLLFAVNLVAPGPWWLLGLAVLVLGVVTNRSTAELFVSFLAHLSPPIDWILRLSVRRREFDEVVHNMDAMLRELKCATPASDALVEMRQNPPYDAGDDTTVCARSFAERLDGKPDEPREGLRAWIKHIFIKPERTDLPTAAVYELLYRERYGLETEILWHSMEPSHRRELVIILAGTLPPFEKGERMADLVEWVLQHLKDQAFSTKDVKREIQAFIDLWLLLSGYAGYLDAVGIQADPKVDDLRPEVDSRLTKGLLADSFEAISTEILTRQGRRWISDWLKSKAADRSAVEVDRLARVSVGIYLADHVSTEHPVLARLAPQIVEKTTHESPAVKMLLTHLWVRSQSGVEGPLSPPFDELVFNWSDWDGDAKKVMGAGFCRRMFAVLESQLQEGKWPTWPPVQQAVAESVQQSRRIQAELKLLTESRKRDESWQKEMGSLLKAIAEPVSGSPEEPGPDPERLIEKVQSAFTEYLQDMLPPKETGASPKSPEEVRKRLHSFAQDHRQEPPLPRQFDEFHSALETMLETQALFRDHAEDLARRLDDVGFLLKAEAAGGSAYIITFDQVKGGIADIIDELKDEYGFEHFTRYARMGKLPPDESFESFYTRFEADLEQRFLAAFATRQLAESEKERFLTELEAILTSLDEEPFPATKWYRQVDVRSGESPEDFLARVADDLEQQLEEHFLSVPPEQRQAACRKWLEAARITAVWEQIEVTVQQISLFHRHDFVIDAKRVLGKTLGKAFSKVFRLPPSSSLVIAADQDRYGSRPPVPYGPH